MARLIETTLGHHKSVELLLKSLERKHFAAVHIFSGPTGVGKARIALGLAQKILCMSGGCGQCPTCTRVEGRVHESLLLVQTENRNLKVEDSQRIREFLRLENWSGPRVVIVDDASQFTAQAANALLKTLEEPPPQTYFFLITAHFHALLSTIRSRSRIITFGTLTEEQLDELSPNEPWILRAADGQLERLRQLSNPDLKDLREHCYQFLSAVTEQRAEQAREHVGILASTLDESLLSVQFLKQMVRDWAVMRYGFMATHEDLAKQRKGPLPVGSLLFSSLVQLEKDLQQNVDRNLLFENFIFQNALEAS